MTGLDVKLGGRRNSAFTLTLSHGWERGLWFYPCDNAPCPTHWESLRAVRPSKANLTEAKIGRGRLLTLRVATNIIKFRTGEWRLA